MLGLPRNYLFVFYFAIMGVLAPLYADLSSPELERLTAKIEPFVIPSSIGSNIIAQVNLKGETFDAVSKILEPHGLTIVTSQSLKEVKINISLRNLSINRVLQFVTQQVNAHWFYRDGRIIIFRSIDELNADFQKIFTQKSALDQQIRIERKRLGKMHAKAEDSALRKVFLTEFSVENLTLARIFEELSSRSIQTDYANGQGISIIPLFNPKSYPEKRSYSFRNQSIAEILDTLCEDSRMSWSMGENALTVSPN
ncbi:MAG: hypothetical protein ACSHYA_04535 [Opitutaceae bacterium]